MPRAFRRLLPALLPAVYLPLLSAQDGLRLESGLAPFQVLQRDGSGRAAASLSGSAPAAGPIEARIVEGQKPVLDWRKIADAAGGKWSGRLEGIPTGGEYRLELRLQEASGREHAAKPVEHLAVGDLWVLAGQSNMEGYGDLKDLERPIPLVKSFDMGDRWFVAGEPLHSLFESVDPVHWGGLTDPAERERRAQEVARTRTKGAGLGLPFGKELVKRTGVPVGLLPCAHGGTSMDQWSPALRDRGGDSLYGSTLRRIRAAGGRVKGVLWYQGESDASGVEVSQAFAGKFEALIAAFRADTGDPDLPFYYVQLGRVIRGGDASAWNRVQESQRLVAEKLPRTAVVTAADLPLDDGIHLSTGGLKHLGRRLARTACRELFDQKHLERGPRLKAVALEGDARIRVQYESVNRALLPSTHLPGFTIKKADGAELPLIYEALVDPDRPDCVILKLGGKPPDGATLWYGAGFDPYLGLVDGEDMAAPVFGPVPIRASATSGAAGA